MMNVQKNEIKMNTIALVRAMRRVANKTRISRREEFACQAIGSELVARARTACREAGLPECLVSTHRVEV
jgi:hypothetical protein